MRLTTILKEMDLFQTPVPRSSIADEELQFIANSAWEEMVKRKQSWQDIERQMIAGRFNAVMNYNTAAGRPVNTPLTQDEMDRVKQLVSTKVEINESPDFIDDDKNGVYLEYSDPDAIPFMYVHGKLEVGNRKETHGDIAAQKKIDLPYNRKSDEIEFSGRMWVGRKYISFWEYPRTKSDIYNVIKDLENEFGKPILGNGWKIELVGGRRRDEEDDMNTGRLVDLDDFLKGSETTIQQRSPEEMGQQHVKSPMIKGKQEIPQGLGSKKRPAGLPVSQYKKMAGITSDSVIKEKRK